MNIRVLLALAVCVVMVAVCAAPASATNIAMINPLMEDPNAVGPLSASAPGQFPYPTWEGVGVTAPLDSVPQGSSTNLPSGWQGVYGQDPSDNIVEVNPTAAQFAGANGVKPLPSPAGIVSETVNGSNVVTSVTNTLYGGALTAPTLGSQSLYNASTGTNDIAVLADTQGSNGVAQTAIILEPNTMYTLTVAVGKDLTGPWDGFSLEIAEATSGTNLVNAEVHNSGQDEPNAGTFYDYAVSFNGSDFVTGAKGAPKAGDVLRVGFVESWGTYCTDVRVTEVTVPEPSTLVLLASGLIGLLAYAWRKRK